MTTDRKRLMSGLALGANPLPLQRFLTPGPGQSYPQQNPGSSGVNRPDPAARDRSPLGAPLSLREVAALIGCSAWTVRQTHVPAGLPCFRSSPNGKLIFYRDQVVHWILSQQQKGGRW